MMEQHRCHGCMELITEEVCPHCGEQGDRQNAPDQLPRGTVLQGQYLVGRVLGQGGYGITYIGLDTQLDMVVAIKEFYPSAVVNRDVTQATTIRLNSESSRDHYESILERFIREARALAKLHDVPQVVRVVRFFRENNTAYIVMEYVRGKDLRHLVREKGGRMRAEELLPILQDVLTALHTVHEAGLVHRDISPDNIMIQPDGTPKLLDFGAVRDVGDSDADIDLSHSTEAILKHGFAPMEQYRSRGNLGPWTDEYGICATVYYCLTGKLPPDAPTRAMGDEDVDWSCVPGLEQHQREALEKGMSMRAKDRFCDLQSLKRAIFEKPVQTQAVKPPEPKDPEVPAKKKKKKKRRVGLTIFLLLMLLIVLTVSALAAAVVGISVFAYLYPNEGAAIMEDVGIPMDTINTFVIETGLTPEVVAGYLEKAGLTEEEIMAWMQEKDITPEKLAKLVEESGITEDTIRAVMEKIMIIPDLIDVLTRENRLGEDPGETTSRQTEGTETTSRPEQGWEKNEMITRPLEILERMGVSRSSIRHAVFLDSLKTAPEYTIDISMHSDGSVLAWLDWSGECCLYIGADGFVNGSNSCQSLFENCVNLSTVSFGGFFRTEGAQSMSNMFEGCINLESVDAQRLDTSNVHTMSGMFCMDSGGAGNDKLMFLDVSGWDLSQVTDCDSMFAGCRALRELDVSDWDVHCVTTMEGMFRETAISQVDVSGWDVSGVVNMMQMFYRCSELTDLDLTGWKTNPELLYDSFCSEGTTVNGQWWEQYFRNR